MAHKHRWIVLIHIAPAVRRQKQWDGDPVEGQLGTALIADRLIQLYVHGWGNKQLKSSQSPYCQVPTASSGENDVSVARSLLAPSSQ